MRVFVTGVNGQLGHDVVNELIKRGHEAIGSDISDIYNGVQDDSPVSKAKYIKLDITDENKVNETLRAFEPKVDAIVHCAAWTAVDLAQEEENKPKVFNINVNGTKYIAQTAKDIDAKMLYLSTDYVFNGLGETPWEPEENRFEPLNYYGETKLLGEKEITSTLNKYFIVRIAWVFGLNGKNFIKTMINVGKSHDEVRVVSDQIGTPTYTFDLARLLVDMIETDKYGFYHATNEGGYISWYDFTKEIYKQYDLSTKVIPVTTAEYGLNKAKRPFNSRLDKSKLVEQGFEPLPDYKDAIARYLKEAKL